METAKTRATAELKNLISDVEELLARVANVKDDDISQLRGKVQDTFDSIKSGLTDKVDAIGDQARRTAESADDFIRDRPWQAIGVAALVGVVVGVLAARRP
jgi:ElaB/YqjD/DUF883 family membrane-anchored ribosome-binding protein